MIMALLIATVEITIIWYQWEIPKEFKILERVRLMNR